MSAKSRTNSPLGCTAACTHTRRVMREVVHGAGGSPVRHARRPLLKPACQHFIHT